MNWFEVNFDGLVGPTHNYAGLSYGNLASTKNQNQDSNPRRAALQGLAKMRTLFDLGVKQAVLPPQLRPDLDFLRNCGFSGSDEDVIEKAAEGDPILLGSASSSAAMWTANAATVSPSADTADRRLHLTPANLISGLHRSLECKSTRRALKAIFASDRFCVHDGLPAATSMGDEGAANHMRVAPNHGAAGIEVFVYGTNAFDQSDARPEKFPARQSLQASQSVARLHGLSENKTLFWKQNAKAIDYGAFHNDVVAVANENVLLCHEFAFDQQSEKIQSLKDLYLATYDQAIHVIQVSNEDLPLEEAVKTYLFNSQIVTVENNQMVLVAPAECENSSNVRRVIERIIAHDNPIADLRYPDVRESMDNGGGPACLRLRVLMNQQQLAEIHQPILFSPTLEEKLQTWIERHYRERLRVEDLGDPNLFLECQQALIELEQILGFEKGTLV